MGIPVEGDMGAKPMNDKDMLLTDEEIEGLARDYAEGFDRFWLSGEPDMKMAITFARVKVREAQLAKVKQHYKQGLFDLISRLANPFCVSAAEDAGDDIAFGKMVGFNKCKEAIKKALGGK